MPESPIYADYTMAAITDSFFKWITMEVSPAYADGNTKAPTGWFCAERVERDDVALYVSETGDARLSTARLVMPGWYLIQHDDDGLVWAHSYEGLDGLREEKAQRRRCMADFSRLTRMYNRWE